MINKKKLVSSHLI